MYKDKFKIRETYTTLTKLVMCKIYTDVGGIK